MLDEIQELNLENIFIIEELRIANVQREGAEYENFALQLDEEGIRDPSVVWFSKEHGKVLLVDGFTRHRWSVSRGKQTLMVVFKNFDDLDHARFWIVKNQGNRRNITDDQKAYNIGRQYNELASEPTKIKAYCKAYNLEVKENERTSDILGKVYGVSEKTVRRNSAYAHGLDRVLTVAPHLGRQLLNGNVITEGNSQIKVNRGVIEKLSQVDLEGSENWADIISRLDKPEKSEVNEKEVELKRAFMEFLHSPTGENKKVLTGLINGFRDESRVLRKTA